MNKFTVLSALVALLLVIYWWAGLNKQESLPLQNEEEYTREFNDWTKNIAGHKTEQSPEKLEAEEAYLKRLRQMAQESMKTINFYGQFVDQYERPVGGVTLTYYTLNETLAETSGAGKAVSDASGLFMVENQTGLRLSVGDFTKLGYQFPERTVLEYLASPEENVPSWKSTSPDNPYVFKVWKVERYPKVESAETKSLLVEGDSRTYTLDFDRGRRPLVEGEQGGDMLVNFERSESDWRITLSAIDGGLVDSQDSFMNLAPEAGYQNIWQYHSQDMHQSVRKSLYFRSKNGARYGALKLIIRPSYRNQSPAIRLKYVVNLEQTRNLATKQDGKKIASAFDF